MGSVNSEAKKSNEATPDFIREAVNSANISCLRVALYHQTKDPELLKM